MFDDIQTLLKENVSIYEIKLKIMAIYGITDVWSCKSRWEIKSLEEFIRKVKDWSETKVSIEDFL